MCVQCALYALLGATQWIVRTFLSRPMTLHALLSVHAPPLESTLGLSHLVAELVCAVWLGVVFVPIVGRSKSVFDHAASAWLLHAVAATVYVGEPPLRVVFWIRLVVCFAITSFVGVRLCRRAELEAIPIGGASRRRRRNNAKEAHEQSVENVV